MVKPPADTPPWFRILAAARSLSRRDGETFTASQLAQEAGIEATAKSRPSQIAAAWLSKLVDWGYVNYSGKVSVGGIRQANAYVVTKTGRTCEVTEGCPGKLVRLITAVRVFEKSRKTPREEAAYRALLETTKGLEG